MQLRMPEPSFVPVDPAGIKIEVQALSSALILSLNGSFETAALWLSAASASLNSGPDLDHPQHAPSFVDGERLPLI